MGGINLRKIRSILKKVNSWKEQMENLSDLELQGKTEEFKRRIQEGESLDKLLPEAFALVREVDKRVLGMFPYDVQVMGAIVMHQGDVAEMSTGEGKTLTATMPLYLNALTGKGVMLVTTNSYLAERDGTEMGEVYRWLGLTVGIPSIIKGIDKKAAELKKKEYSSDIVYVTNSALGFDYLIDNLSVTLEDRQVPDFNYAIIDEIDSVLLDSAQTPLVISGAPRVKSNLPQIANTFVTTLEKGRDYKFHEVKKELWLLPHGVELAEKFFELDNLYDEENKELVRHILLAMKAHFLFKRGKDYEIHEDKVELLDSQTGRLMELTRLQGGQHQAIEAKEYVEISNETRAMASITYQNLFKLFKKLGGMTGTGKVAEAEFIETYSMKVITIPTNRKRQRIDLPDKIYASLPEKIFASLEHVKSYHQKGNPILVFVGSVEMSLVYSSLLLREGIAHNLLNATNAAREAQIIAESGQRGAVTVATSMAGRGTDIKLGPGVAELGGLIIIGTERMQNQRVDLQIRGRSGRQGDPGLSQFFISLEDDLIKNWGPDWVKKYYKDYSSDTMNVEPILLKSRKFKTLVNKAQTVSESSARMIRKITLEFAESMNIQRSIIYEERLNLLQKTGLLNKELKSILEEVIDHYSDPNLYDSTADLYRFLLDNFSYDTEQVSHHFKLDSREEIKELLWDTVNNELNKKRAMLNDDQLLLHFQRVAMLKSIDKNWIEQVDYLQQLRMALSGQHSSQKNPIVEYYQEAFEGFERMKWAVKEQIVRNLLLSIVEVNPKGEVVMHFP